MVQMADAATEVLEFWFGASTDANYGQERLEWFRKDPAFDAQLRDRFLPLYEQVVQGQFMAWQAEPLSCLALVIILDQFSRNLFRDNPQAFAADAQALAIAQSAIDQGFDQDLLPVQRWFYYLPFEHSEDLAQQTRSLQLHEQLRHDPASASTIEYAYKHYEIIERFGRFPHRNAILGRPSTPAELEFLKQPGSSF